MMLLKPIWHGFFGYKHKDEVTLCQHSGGEFWIRIKRGHTNTMKMPYQPIQLVLATRRDCTCTVSIVCFMMINAAENYYSQNIIYSVVKFIVVVSHEYEMKVDGHSGYDCVWGLCYNDNCLN